jgi:hypothetical protein
MKTSLNYLHHQSAEWIREVTFYKEELNVLKTRLGDVVSQKHRHRGLGTSGAF